MWTQNYEVFFIDLGDPDLRKVIYLKLTPKMCFVQLFEASQEKKLKFEIFGDELNFKRMSQVLFLVRNYLKSGISQNKYLYSCLFWYILILMQ